MGFKVGYDERNQSHFIQQKIRFKLKEHVIRIRNAVSPDGVYEIGFVETNIVQYFVPFSGIYKLEAWGATGGSESTTTGPKGAYSRSYVYLKKDEKLEILVGEKGFPGYNNGDSKYCGVVEAVRSLPGIKSHSALQEEAEVLYIMLILLLVNMRVDNRIKQAEIHQMLLKEN